MTEGTTPRAVTRGELYPILGSVYLLIAFALLGWVRSGELSTLILIGHALLFVVALGMSVTFSFMGIRERRRAQGTATAGRRCTPSASAGSC